MTKKHATARSTVTARTVNAFIIEDGTGGNPAGVVLDADDLQDADMLRVAASIGLSETAFVSRSATEGARLDFFTPTRRIAHCGHATIAAFALLRSLGRIGEGMTSKETVDGPRRILVSGSMVFMEQLAPAYRLASDWADAGVGMSDVLDAVGLDPGRLDPRVAPQVVDTGNRFLVIGVRHGDDLARLRPDAVRVERISEALDLIGCYLFTTDRGATDADATARMFAPRFGIAEESATGMAAGPLACLLHDALGMRGPRFVIEQGRYMVPASRSRITVDLALKAGRIGSLMAGGEARVTRTSTLPMTGRPGGRSRRHAVAAHRIGAASHG